MATKLRRIQVNLSIDLETMLEKTAAFSGRPISSQIVMILEDWALEKKRELDYFRPAQLHEAARSEAQVFETHRPQHAAELSKLRDSLGKERS